MSRRAAHPRRTAYGLSCTDLEWERVRARARRHGRSASRYLVERALPKATRDRTPRLVLTEREQRAVLGRLEAIEALLLGAAGGKEAVMDSLQRRVAVLVKAKMDDMRRAGRAGELEALLGQVLGEEAARRAMAQYEGVGRG